MNKKQNCKWMRKRDMTMMAKRTDFDRFLKDGWYFSKLEGTPIGMLTIEQVRASESNYQREHTDESQIPVEKQVENHYFKVNVVRTPSECVHNKTYVALVETRESAPPVNMCVIKNECCKDLEHFPEWCPLAVVEYVGEINDKDAFEKAVKEAVKKKDESLLERLGKL